MARHIRLTSVINAIRCVLNRNKTSTKGECTDGPTIKVSLSEMPVEVAAEASNTARILVVVLDY